MAELPALGTDRHPLSSSAWSVCVSLSRQDPGWLCALSHPGGSSPWAALRTLSPGTDTAFRVGLGTVAVVGAWWALPGASQAGGAQMHTAHC